MEKSILHPLRLRRLEWGLSQHALSFLTGVPQFKICYYEKGYSVLKEEQKRRIADALETPVRELFPEAAKDGR